MDHERFDGLTRLLASTGSRRAALGALLGVLPGSAMRGQGLDALAKKGKTGGQGTRRGKGKAKRRKRKTKPQQPDRVQAAACFPRTTNCQVGRMKNGSDCNWANSTAFGPNKDLFKYNGSRANFRAVNFMGANLSDANLTDACLVGANLTGANLTRTNMSRAIRCRTTRPDGTTDDTGCGLGTACCPTCDGNEHCAVTERCCAGRCVPGDCCTNADCAAPGAVCDAGTCSAGCDVCPVGCPFTSLQAAVAAAPLTGGTIHICPGTYTTVNVFINKSLTIIGSGDGPGGTILDAQQVGRVLQIAAATVTIRDLSVTRGRNGAGGAIFINGMLTLERVHVTDNATPGAGSGGAIFVFPGSTLTLKGSRITNNTAANSFGGGIDNRGTLTLDASRVEDNTAGNGGGIGNAGIVNLTNGSIVGSVDPLKGNTATFGPGSGGGILNSGTVTGASASSVTGNTPDNCVNNLGGTGC